MKKLMGLLSLVAWSALATQFQPIVQFDAGEYLGLGRYVDDTGRFEFYSSHANFSADTWKLSYVSGIGTSFYNLSFKFSVLSNGFFDIVMHRDTPGPGSGEYSGHGFCGSRQCYLYASLDDFVLQETITFTSDAQAYRLGSLRYLDEYSNTRVIAWDEKMSKINQDNPWVVAPAVPFPCFPPPDREDDDVAYPVTPVPVCPIPIPIPVGLRS